MMPPQGAYHERLLRYRHSSLADTVAGMRDWSVPAPYPGTLQFPIPSRHTTVPGHHYQTEQSSFRHHEERPGLRALGEPLDKFFSIDSRPVCRHSSETELEPRRQLTTPDYLRRPRRSTVTRYRSMSLSLR